MTKKYKVIFVLVVMLLTTIFSGVTRGSSTDQDKKLAKLVKDAKLIVTGKVIDISPIGRQNSKSSEWYIVTIKVIGPPVRCTFSDCEAALAESSQQVMLRIPNANNSDPNLETGQERIFILVDSRSKLRSTTFTLSSNLQIQPLENLDKIRDLMR